MVATPAHRVAGNTVFAFPRARMSQDIRFLHSRYEWPPRETAERIIGKALEEVGKKG